MKTYISLFSSAGVGCYGFKLNGFKCIATNELIERRLDVQKHNNICKYKSGYINGDIRDKKVIKKIYNEIDYWKKNHKINSPDVLLSTPPCQGMSLANHKKKNEISRNSLIVESIIHTKKIYPRFFIYENVQTFLTTLCTDKDGIDKPIKDVINFHLSGHYNILFKKINFKDHGANSSRTRIIVIGVRKDLENISPYDIFPVNKKGRTLRKLIGDIKSLKKMGEISDDIYHSFKIYDKRMLNWIKDLDQGESAFQNKSPKKRPHRIINGKILFNKEGNGDKYQRCYWDKVAPCIHTRNDILASQNTIHPSDNRVFSIRELMIMMTIPKSFNWTDKPEKRLNELSLENKRIFLKKNEINIRQCIGEAVPTIIFKSIAKNINNVDADKKLSMREISKVLVKYNLHETNNLIRFIDNNFEKYTLSNIFLICEFSNIQRINNASYYTRRDLVFNSLKILPDIKKNKLRIIEPSVGVGNFLPLLFEKYKNVKDVELDLFDIDLNSIKILKLILSKITIPSNFKIKIFNEDFLLYNFKRKYDILVGNPPFKRITKDKELINLYKKNIINQDSNNLVSFFIEKALKISNFISLITPKSILSNPEYKLTRDLLISNNIIKIIDYGEKGFKGVKIETIGVFCKSKRFTDKIIIESYIKKSYLITQKDYVFSDDLPYWLIYRDKFFDRVFSSMKLGIFESFRDRQITKSITRSKGKIRVIKSRNISNNSIENIKGYDCYIDEIKNLAVSKYLNKPNILMIPNLTYYPRGCMLPKNSIVDGSVALLTKKNGSKKLSKSDIQFYNSEEFTDYYKVARNYGTRSLNIDKSSVFFFGVKK